MFIENYTIKMQMALNRFSFIIDIVQFTINIVNIDVCYKTFAEF